MDKSVRFRIPASTSNLGAGLDTLGLALSCHLTVTIEPATNFEIESRGVNLESIPAGQNNLILQVARRVAAQRGHSLPSVHLTIENEIPLARGLGSSAAAIIAGITCYEIAAEDRLSDDEIFRYALEFESHPDNLAAALYGGLIAAATATDGRVAIAKLRVAEGIQQVVVIPEFELPTERARAVLPQSYSRSDAVYNIQRSALAVAALTTGNWSLLREAMRDRIHQSFRAPLIPGLTAILELDIPGLMGIALSGAGPTVFAFATIEAADAVGSAIASIFAAHDVQSISRVLTIDTEGRSF